MKLQANSVVAVKVVINKNCLLDKKINKLKKNKKKNKTKK